MFSPRWAGASAPLAAAPQWPLDTGEQILEGQIERSPVYYQRPVALTLPLLGYRPNPSGAMPQTPFDFINKNKGGLEASPPCSPKGANDAEGGPVGTNAVSNWGPGRKPRMGHIVRPLV
jgi:hypothetical protein